MTELYLKWMRAGRVPPHQGGAPIPLRRWTPTAVPVLCESGWHACRWEDALTHMSQELWVCKLRGELVEGSDKVAASSLILVRRVPLDDAILRLFAADAAERVLILFEDEHPNDGRPRAATETARAFARGECTPAELESAASAAYTSAYTSAYASASAAAADAEAAAYAAYASASAAAADAEAAAYAAYAAASAAAADAEAAAYAAYAAASAAEAASYASYAASAASAAAADAEAAEREWQTSRLLAHYAQLNPAHFAHRETS